MCIETRKSIPEQLPAKEQELAQFMAGLDVGADMEVNRSYLILSLHRAQTIFGYLPMAVQKYVAKILKLQLADVYGVISFYSFFSTTPPGKFKINVCMGTACFVKGATKILSKFETLLKIKNGETGLDREFSLGSLRCVGACSLAPVAMVNDTVYGNVTQAMVGEILKNCRKENKNVEES